jgi:hypothetical protein
MQQHSITTQVPEDLHALFSDLAAMLPGWDLSRPTSELSSALKERLSFQPITQTGKRRGKSMSRRRGQTPKIEKHGRFYTVRGREDEEGQEKRVHKRIKISPIDRKDPAWLNKPEREREARKAVAKLDDNGEVVVRNSEPVTSRHVTFGEQCDRHINQLREREKPAASSSVKKFESYIKIWLKPMLGNLPLGKVNNGAAKRLTEWMKKGGPMPSYPGRKGNGNGN